MSSGVQNTFSTGAHTVSETTDPTYTAVISGDCAANGQITLAAGDVKACTITNTFNAPKLTVTKVVVNTGGGTKVSRRLPVESGCNDGVSGVQNTFGTGPHTVSETTDPTYTAVISGDCAANGSITLAANDVKACTITNTFNAPKLTVTKVVVNTGGGTKVIADFPLKVDATTVTSGVQNTFSTGPHTVSETTDPTYTAVISRRLRGQRLDHAGGQRRQGVHDHQHVHRAAGEADGDQGGGQHRRRHQGRRRLPVESGCDAVTRACRTRSAPVRTR